MADVSVLVALLAAAGALAVGATALSRPLVAFGILFLIASISRVTLETPVGTMRLDHPAIAVAALVLLAGGRFRLLLSLPRSVLAIALAFGGYLVVLALSSAFVAPEPASSLRLVAWLAISMVGGIVAFALVRPQPLGAMEPLAFAGAAKGAVGFAVAAMFLVAGPAFDLGIQGSQTVLPRVHAFTWEANLYASFLAMCVPFALEATLGPRRAIGLIMLVLVVVGLPLGETRGAYLGAVAGLVAYAAVRLAWERRPAYLPVLIAVTAISFIAGMIASNILLPNAVERQAADAVSSPASSAPVAASASPTSSLAPSPASSASIAVSGSPTSSLAPSPASSASAVSESPTSSLAPYPDTVRFRLDRIPVALGDLPRSPLIGLGAQSFGQRHLDPSRPGEADHLGILAVAAIYEAGILGGAALASGFILVVVGLWRAAAAANRAGDRPSVGAAAAFIGSLASMLVSYQATNALHFAINWIIVGAAIGLIARTRMSDKTVNTKPPDDST